MSWPAANEKVVTSFFLFPLALPFYFLYTLLQNTPLILQEDVIPIALNPLFPNMDFRGNRMKAGIFAERKGIIIQVVPTGEEGLADAPY